MISRPGSSGCQSREAGLKGFLALHADVIWVLALTVLIRALVCALTNNEPGDPDARAVDSAEWALSPSFILSGTWLPMHFYVTGVLMWILGNPITAGKALSFITGSLAVIPLFELVRRLFDRRTALITGLYFAIYGTQVGLSSTVMSEAPLALFALLSLNVLFAEIHSQTPRARGVVVAAIFMAIAGCFRQEAWQLAGIVTLYLLCKPRTRRYAILFGLVSLSTFAAWAITNAVAGEGWEHALLAVANAKNREGHHTQFSAAHNLLKWIWIYVQSPGPVISGLAVLGLYQACKRRLPASLGLIAALLVGPYVLLSVVKPSWLPQPRYAVISELLILPYAAAATVGYFRERRPLQIATAAILLVSVASQCVAFRRGSHLFLPVLDYDANDVSAWTWLAGNVSGASAVIVEDTGYRSAGLVSHSGMYTHEHPFFHDFDAPVVLERIVAAERSPMILVLHSPLSKWDFLQHLNPQLVYQNADYRIVRVQPVK